jgi:hypothetical protein
VPCHINACFLSEAIVAEHFLRILLRKSCTFSGLVIRPLSMPEVRFPQDTKRGPIVRGHCWGDPECLEDLRLILRVILLSVQYARGLESENHAAATAINNSLTTSSRFTVHCARVQQWTLASRIGGGAI